MYLDEIRAPEDWAPRVVIETRGMQSTPAAIVVRCGLVLVCAGGCPYAGNDSETGTATSANDSDDSLCPVEPSCAGVQLDDPLFDHGWAMGGDGAPLTLFLSSPGTACGDQNPGRCTSCGIYQSVTITLSPEAQMPGVYDETSVDLDCRSFVSDCHGNAGELGGPVATASIEIVSIDEDCVVGELLDSASCSGSNPGQFAAIRCPS